jgi:signal transduction histidine kinase
MRSVPTQRLGAVEGQAPAVQVKLSPVAWIPCAQLGYAEWLAAGSRLGLVGRSSQWWIGDWIRFGNTRFGERYTRAARITGYDVQSLTNMVYVANRFEISRRRETLSWSHHEALAACPVVEQERWFKQAIAGRWSVADLRTELRSAKALAKRQVELDESCKSSEPSDVVICPECGYTIRDSLHGR